MPAAAGGKSLEAARATPQVVAPANPPMIPENWRELSWNELRSLAANLRDDDEPVKTKADAIEHIEAFLAE